MIVIWEKYYQAYFIQVVQNDIILQFSNLRQLHNPVKKLSFLLKGIVVLSEQLYPTLHYTYYFFNEFYFYVWDFMKTCSSDDSDIKVIF